MPLPDREKDLLRADLLDQAWNLIRSAAKTLDGTRSRCQSCGLLKLSDLDDGRKLEQLSGVMEKLQRLSASFRTRGV